MNSQDIAAIVNREISQARGYDSDTLSARRAEALNLYNGIVPAASEGRSQFVSLDVSDSVHATLAQVCPVVRTSQVEFEATSQEDEQQAQTETDFVRVSIERAGGFVATDEATFDALLVGNGWLYAYVDETVQVTEQRFPPDLPDEAVFALTAMAPPDTKITLSQGKEFTTAKVEKTIKRLMIEAVAPEDMLFSECGDSYDIDQLPFVARIRLYTAGALAAKGIDKALIENLPDATNDEAGEIARQGKYANDGLDNSSAQDANRLKRVYCCYIRLSDGDNLKTELRHIWIGESQSDVLLNEPADFVPFIAGSAIPMPHRIVGTGIAELLKDVMLAKTHTLRQYMDNLEVMNGSRVSAVEGQVNMADLTNGRINGVVRVRSPGAVTPLPAGDIGPQAINALGYLDHIRSQRVGSALDFNEVQAQLMGTSATAAAGQLSKVEQMGGWFAGNLVRTMMLPLFLLVHRILRTQMGGVVMARIGGKWQQTDTSQWSERDVTDIQMGLTTTEKAERMMALSQTIQMMQGMLASGGAGIIVDLPRLYNAMGDWIRTANLGSPDQYLIDPNSPESQQAVQMQQQSQKQQQEESARIQAELIKLQQNFELEKQIRELQFKKWDAELSAEIEEAKLTTSGIIETKKLSIQALEGSRERNETANQG